jgi:chromosomal replication initiation ATPase DnaA
MEEARTGEQTPQSQQEIPVDNIVGAVGRYYGYTSDELFGRDREDSALTDARAVMYTLLADNTPLLNKQIAEMAERVSVSQVIRRVRKDAAEDPRMKDHLETLAAAAVGEPLGETPASWTVLVEEHYGMTAEEISTSRAFRALEARQVLAHLLVEKTVLRRQAVARRTGYTGAVVVSNAMETLEERRQEDPDFAKQLEKLEAGELPEAGMTEDEAFDRVGAYYGVTREDLLGTDRQAKYMRARLMAMYVLARGVGYNYEDAGRAFGRNSNVREQVLRFEESLENDERLRAEADYLLDPDEAPRPPTTDDILANVCEYFNVGLAELRHPDSGKARTAKRMTVRVLSDEMSLPPKEIAELLEDTVSHVRWHLKRISVEIERNPKLILDIDGLKPEHSVSLSLATRILRHVSKSHYLKERVIKGRNQTPELNKVRSIIVTLMQHGGYTQHQVASMMGMPVLTVKRLTNGSLASLSENGAHS